MQVGAALQGPGLAWLDPTLPVVGVKVDCLLPQPRHLQPLVNQGERHFIFLSASGMLTQNCDYKRLGSADPKVSTQHDYDYEDDYKRPALIHSLH